MRTHTNLRNDCLNELRRGEACLNRCAQMAMKTLAINDRGGWSEMALLLGCLSRSTNLESRRASYALEHWQAAGLALK